jgi:NTE family protein
MRGAYEVGIIHGILEVLGRKAEQPPLFSIYAGCSVGAINAAYLAANADRGDYAIEQLIEIWTSLRLEQHARVRPLGLVRVPRRAREATSMLNVEPHGASLLDTRPLEHLVRTSVDWESIHQNVEEGTVRALVVAALHVVSGRTTIFIEKNAEQPFQGSRDERRVARFERIGADHVLASAAIPLLFPTRRVGQHFYCDGGMRFNTPIAPAIRAGAERLVVVLLRHQRTPNEVTETETAAAAHDFTGRDLTSTFLVGKLLNALLLDPVMYDLQVLERINQMMGVLHEALDEEELERVQRVWIRTRGAPYRELETLVFTPSRDLGQVAGEYLRSERFDDVSRLIRYLLRRASRHDVGQEADWASYLLFDGGFAEALMASGRADAHAKADQIRAFFRERD